MATQMRRHNVPAEQEIRFWMRAPALTVNQAAPLSEALALMREHDVRRLPVVTDEGTLCGMITQGDICGADVLRAGGIDTLAIASVLHHIQVCQVMAERPIAVTPETGLREAAMRRNTWPAPRRCACSSAASPPGPTTPCATR